jgi:hypothetical protein
MNTNQKVEVDVQGDTAIYSDLTKKEYDTPTVTVHGTVAEITKFTGPFLFDGITGSIVISDRGVKADFAPVDAHDVLMRLAAIPVETWSYKFEDSSVRHIGPMAQDFAAAFGMGDSDRLINMVDASGVSIAAIQALYGMLQERDQEMLSLRSEVDEIKRQLAN